MKLRDLFISIFKKYCTRSPNVSNSANISNSIKIGDEITISVQITQDDVLNFAKLTGDYNPIHTNSLPNLVHGALLNGLVSGVIGTKVPGPGTIVVQQNLKFPNPCYTGDKIEIKVLVTSVRKIMKCEYTCIANGKKVVLEGDAKLMKK